MIRVLTRRAPIRRAERRLQRLFREAADREGEITMGFQGDRLREPAYYVSDIDVWAAFRSAENRYWSAFGKTDPFDDAQNVPITVEINPPHEGINRSIGGIFGVDAEDRVHLLHRGMIGGGRKGIGKTNFFHYLRGRWPLTRVEDGERQSDVIEITCLEAEHPLAHIEAFVALVEAFKTAITEDDWSPAESKSDAEGHEYRPEYQGTRKVPGHDPLTHECDHGVVVHRLVQELRDRGLPAANDQARDAYVPPSGPRRGWLFEVKTGTDAQAVYTALGQLVFHAPEPFRRVAVLPEETPEKLRQGIRKRGMKVLPYRWRDDLPVFADLTDLLASDGPGQQ